MRTFFVVVFSLPLLVSAVSAASAIRMKEISAESWILVQTAERNFTIVNKTGITVNTVSAKLAAVNGAQDVALLSAALAANGSANVAINIAGNGCVFDLKINGLNAVPKVLKGVDLCQTDSLLLE